MWSKTELTNKLLFVVGRGKLSKALWRTFKNENTQLIRLTREDFDFEDSIQNIEDCILKKGFCAFSGENPSSSSILRDFRFPAQTCLINAAAFTDVDGAEEDQQSALIANAYGPYKLAVICKILGIKFIHISTDFVFDGRASKPYSEYDRVSPVNWYGKTKEAGEKMVENSGCESAIIRTGWLYDDDNGIIPKLIEIIRGERELAGVSDQLIAPTHAKDVAEQIKTIWRKRLNGIFHVTSEKAVSPYELLKYISEKINGGSENINKSNRFDFFKKATRPQNCILMNFNLEALGLNAMPTWKQSVDALLERLNDERRRDT